MTMHWLLLMVVGLAVGALSGLLGIGGGVIVVPVLVMGFGFSQHTAQGTSMALFALPIGLLAAITYYRHGHVNLPAAGLICLGFVIGGLLGARLAVILPELLLRRVFGIFLLVISVRLIFFK